MMDINRELLISCLLKSYDYYTHDGLEEDEDEDVLPYDDYEKKLHTMSLEQLIEETDTDDDSYPLKKWIEIWGGRSR